ncbi:UDP-N-acetylmuramoyl-tripeptide--D-alanyl-D-alanine ligase [Catenovulum sp. 2E275]|uniref:UDP-N-acetylmuramoyl-tripeptide--D-alanyl-D- alanine ligase n=1 Tax=Catenovulum sp. 2E275 TaxID=2980497 RepID=UPI0021D200B7|nr:UDP-N-acetylmuramoyl-tripeptide--D-alanyl-D-alanine ligase [Catenovulum sp. 2E275]MCU4674216.1 UDP-N-acetylmuramoyl-tripeptide--D-alanyl-D-alanine ligase [Catenovulum sp. 2E275]
MIPVKLSQWQQITQGQMLGDDIELSSISHDSRQLDNVDVYLAIKGDKFDGHAFCREAVEKGVKCLVVNQPQDLAVSQLVVADTRIALGQIAAYNKQVANVKTVAITGSCGKTTVKEMLLSICQLAGQTLATKGNFNNDIGAPLTLLRLSEHDQYAVIELGANHQGEIAYTAGLTQPDVAVINNVGAAHLEGFGSLEGVAQAKGEIYQALPQHGIAVVNSDSEFVHFWQNDIAHLQQISFSTAPFADVYYKNLSLDEQLNPSFEWVYRGQSYFVRLPLAGEHNAKNALAAISCALALGISAELINLGLAQVKSTNGRAHVHQINHQIKLIDDTYNANLSSMKAAVDLLAKARGHHFFVMGDMGEMGDYGQDLHQQVGEHVRNQQIEHFYTLGELTQFAQFKPEYHFKQIEGLIETIKQDVKAILSADSKAEINILVKGSRSAQMERVVVALKPYFEEFFAC